MCIFYLTSRVRQISFHNPTAERGDERRDLQRNEVLQGGSAGQWWNNKEVATNKGERKVKWWSWPSERGGDDRNGQGKRGGNGSERHSLVPERQVPLD